VLLTRDVELLKVASSSSARSSAPTERAAQFVEVVERFDLAPHMRPFTRCPMQRDVARASANEVASRVPERVRQRAVPHGLRVVRSPLLGGLAHGRIRRHGDTVFACVGTPTAGVLVIAHGGGGTGCATRTGSAVENLNARKR